MSTDNHLQKFKQFAENNVKRLESKQVLTEKEKEFLAQQRAYVANFNMLDSERLHQILQISKEFQLSIQSKIDIALEKKTGDNFMQKNNFSEIIGVKYYEINEMKESGYVLFFLNFYERQKKEVPAYKFVEKQKEIDTTYSIRYDDECDEIGSMWS